MKKSGSFPFFIASTLLILSMFIPNDGVSMPNPWTMIVNHAKKQCAQFFIGVGNDLDSCDLDSCEGWIYVRDQEYNGNYICPEGYQNTKQSFKDEKCQGTAGGPWVIPPGEVKEFEHSNEPEPMKQKNSYRSHGFGCAPISHYESNP